MKRGILNLKIIFVRLKSYMLFHLWNLLLENLGLFLSLNFRDICVLERMNWIMQTLTFFDYNYLCKYKLKRHFFI